MPIFFFFQCGSCWELIIHTNIISHLDSTGILTETQHGFRKKQSCVSQLILTIHDMAKSLSEVKLIRYYLIFPKYLTR